MRIIWKKYTVGAFLLAFLALLIAGCGDYGATPAVRQVAPVTKSVSGFVSYPTTGLPLPGATVTVYAIDAAGAVASTPLPGSGFAISDVDGSYSIKIPADYAGSLMLMASIPASHAARLLKSSPAALLATDTITIRALLPATLVSLAELPSTMISFATEAVVVFLEQNVTAAGAPAGFTPSGFSSDNIRKADIVMETFFGPNFSQVPPPKSDSDVSGNSQSQQNLLVSIQALNTVTANPSTPMTLLVVKLSGTGLGSDLAAVITAAIEQAVTALAGVLPAGYQPSPAIVAAVEGAADTPVTGPSLTDTTPPTVPTGLTASPVNATTVRLAWSPSSDPETGVAGYNVYRFGPGTTYQLIATLGSGQTAYSDTGAAASTSYSYQVNAFNGARLTSDPSASATATTPAASSTPASTSTVYSLTGRVTSNGAPLAGVLLDLNGAGTGSALSGADGSYTFFVLNGSYVITPSRPGYQFSPLSIQVTVSDADLSGKDFGAVLNGSAVGTVTFPDGAVSGSVSYPNGAVTSAVSYPGGTVIGGISYPPGTVVSSVTYPNGTVIAGVSYPAGTVISSVRYPSGAVVGGVTYPSGSVTMIVTYPSGAVVGGVSYPSGLIVTTLSYPNGAVLGGVSYPAGTVFTVVVYPAGAVVGGVGYPPGTVVSTVTLPTAAVIGGVSYPAGTTISSVSYPGGSVVGGVSYPSGTLVVTVRYPDGTVSTQVSYPAGAVAGGVSYPSGVVAVTVSYPNGTVSTTVRYPGGTVVGGVSYPAGTVVVTVSYPDGIVTSSVSYPDGTVRSSVSYPDGIVTGGVSYPAGTVISTVSYPDGTVASSVTYSDGSVSGSLNYGVRVPSLPWWQAEP